MSMERAGIAVDSHPAGTPEATGLERRWPRENRQRVSGAEWGGPDEFVRWNHPVRRIMRKRDRSSRSGPVRSLPSGLSVSGSSQQGRVCARPDTLVPAAWGVERDNGGQ